MTDDDRTFEVARALAGAPISSIERQAGGGNNRLFRVATTGGQIYAMKEYPLRSGDGRDRLGTEFNALRFMEQRGIRDVPKAFEADRNAGFALYEWIGGQPLTKATEADIDHALAFIARLHECRTAPGANDLPLASEACLSANEIIKQVDRRLERLREVALSDARLANFLSQEYAITAQAVETWARRGVKATGLDVDRSIEMADRSLSPSDFGFHNAIRRDNGQLIFVDFEYFGWDDPTKLVADFLLHPGMRLEPRQYERFRVRAESIYSNSGVFAAKLALVYPLYGLRWCMILLNEFMPERWEARRRAGLQMDRDIVLAGQLEKAKQKISTVRQYILDHAQ